MSHNTTRLRPKSAGTVRNRAPRMAEAPRTLNDNLSTNNKGFVAGIGFKQEPLSKLVNEDTMDDDDIRLERYKPGFDDQIIPTDVSAFSRNMKLMDESPNGYEVTGDAPDPYEFDASIDHYTEKLKMFNSNYPCEWALCHYNLGLAFFSDNKRGNNDTRSKRVENALFHFDKCIHFFTHETYPAMWSIICLLIGHLYRERSCLVKLRSFLSTRGPLKDSIRKGLDNIAEANTVFIQSSRMRIELAVASLQTGWLYLLLGEEPVKKEDDEHERTMLFEQSVTHCERCMTIVNTLDKEYEESEFKRARPSNPQDPEKFAPHIYRLLDGHPLSMLEGEAMYVAARAFASLSPGYKDQKEAFDYFNRCVKPRYMDLDSNLWVDAHIRVANVILDTPTLVDPNYTPPENSSLSQSAGLSSASSAADLIALAQQQAFAQKKLDSSSSGLGLTKSLSMASMSMATGRNGGSPNGDLKLKTGALTRSTSFRRNKNASGGFQVDSNFANMEDGSHFESAITHLTLCLRSKASKARLNEIQFAIAQVNLSKLHMIIDNLPPGRSLTSELLDKGGNDVIDHIEYNLESGLERITAATMNTQDAYIYFFSCLKMSELKMLQTASRRGLAEVDKRDLLEKSVHHLSDALVSRSITQNVDLHYISMTQMSQMLQATQRIHGALKVSVKMLLCLSSNVMRARYVFHGALHPWCKEVDRQVGNALHCSQRLTKWIRKHIKPFATNKKMDNKAQWMLEFMPEHESAEIDGVPDDYHDTWKAEFDKYHMFDHETPEQRLAREKAETKKEQEEKRRRLREQEAMPKDPNDPTLSPNSRIEAAMARGAANMSPPKIGGKKKKAKISFDVLPKAPEVPDTASKGIDVVEADGTLMKVKSKNAKGKTIWTLPPKVKMCMIPALGWSFSVANAMMKDDEERGPYMVVNEIDYYNNGPYLLRVRPLVPVVSVQAADQFLNSQEPLTNRLYVKEFHKQASEFEFAPEQIQTLEERLQHLHPERKPDSPIHKAKRDDAKGVRFSEDVGLNTDTIDHFTRNLAITSDNANSEDRDDQTELTLTTVGDQPSLATDPPRRRGLWRQIFFGSKKKDRMRKLPPAKSYQFQDNVSYDYHKSVQHGGQADNLHTIDEQEFEENDVESEITLPTMAPEKKPAGLFSLITRPLWENRDGMRDRLDRQKRERALVEIRLRLWATERCAYTAHILSRQSRLALVSLSNRLEAGRGERARALATELPNGLMKDLRDAQLLLKDACKGQKMPPLTLKGLSSQSYDDIAFLFKDQVAISKHLKKLEEIMLLRFPYETGDNSYFIPLVCAASCFTRHISGYDDRLLSAEMILRNNRVFDERPPTPPRVPTPPSEMKRDESVEYKENEHDSGTGPMPTKKERKKMREEAARKAADEASSKMSSYPGTDKALASGNAFGHLRADPHAVGKVTLESVLSASLDGTGMGLRELLTSHLSKDEVMLWWHVPPNSKHNIQCILAWREPDQDGAAGRYGYVAGTGKDADPGRRRNRNKKNRSRARHAEDLDERLDSDRFTRKKGEASKFKAYYTHQEEMKMKLEDGVVLELVRSNATAGELNQWMQELARSLRMHPMSPRLKQSEIALAALSFGLSISELLCMFPPHYSNLVILGPPIIRMVPWSAIQIEVDGYEHTVEAPLGERYNIRLGPTLSLLELTSEQGSRIKHAIGNFKLLCVDASTESTADTELETDCVRMTYSKEPQDYYVLGGGAATPTVFRTSPIAEVKRELFRAATNFRKEAHEDKLKKKEEKVQRAKIKMLERQKLEVKNGRRVDRSQGGTHVDDEDSDLEEDKSVDSKQDDDLSLDSTFEENLRITRNKLKECRVLHITAGKANFRDTQSHLGAKHATMKMSALAMATEEGGPEDGRQHLSSLDIVKQLYLPNNALTVLSRYGVYDGLNDIRECEPNLDLIDAFHLAGAATVMHPLWGGYNNGSGGILANMLILLRFYGELPTYAASPFPVTDALRRSQQWLREIEYPDLVQWIRTCHLPREQQLALSTALETFQLRQKRESDVFYRERQPGRIFQHFIYWSSFSVSGYAREIHPESVAIRDEKTKKQKISGALKMMFGEAAASANLHKREEKARTKARHRELLLEADVLWYEGKRKEAREMRRQVQQEKKEIRKRKIVAGINFFKNTYANLKRGVDSMLDSDSDKEESTDEEEAITLAASKYAHKTGKSGVELEEKSDSGDEDSDLTDEHEYANNSSDNEEDEQADEKLRLKAKAKVKEERDRAAGHKGDTDADADDTDDNGGGYKEKDDDASTDSEERRKEEEYYKSFKYYKEGELNSKACSIM